MFTTDDSPLATRCIIGVIPLEILTGAGTVFLMTVMKRMHHHFVFLFASLLGFAMITSLFLYLQAYFVAYPLYSSDFWGWQYGPGEIMTYFTTQQDHYNDLVMQPIANAQEIFYSFYDPKGCPQCKTGTPDDSYNPNRRQLFALTPDYLLNHPEFTYTTQKNIYYPDGSLAFVIAQVNK